MSEITRKPCSNKWSGITILSIIGGFFFGYLKGRREYNFARETFWLKYNQDITFERNDYISQIKALTTENNKLKGIKEEPPKVVNVKSGDMIDAFTNIEI